MDSGPTAIQDCLNRIDELDPDIQAWTQLAREDALKQAGQANGPLAGVPFGVKDIFDTAGMPTEWGTVVQKGRIPTEDAALVARLKELGAVVLGKTHTTAFAYFDPAPTRNPKDLDHTPGGSSSGSAAAVAAGMVPFALGSQTQGSVLRPASFCGIVGWKPTFGTLPLAGVMPFAPSLDHAGILVRSVADLIEIWEALTGPVAGTSASSITVLDWPIEGQLEPAMARAFEDSIGKLAETFEIVEAPTPDSFKALPAATATIMTYEAAQFHGAMLRDHGPAIGSKLAALIENGLAIDESAYREAKSSVDIAKAKFVDWSKQHRVVATPAALGPAPRGLESTGDPRCSIPWTTLGAPAISVPMPTNGLPLGLQLTAGYGSEATLLQTAQKIED